MIEVQKLVKAFGYFPVLRGLDLTIEAGQFVALLGPNGSGKTTLLRILAGLSKPTSGTVKMGGWSIPDELAAVRRQLGIVSHQTLIYDNLTAEENLIFFARLYDIPVEARADRANEMLRQVGLAKRAKDVVQTFSRGMQQRLAIARALLHDPAILLLDEPHTGLDQNAAALLDTLLRDVAGVGTGERTAVMTTHDLRRARDLTTHVAILQRGKVGYFGPMTDIGDNDLPALYATTVEAKTAS